MFLPGTSNPSNILLKKDGLGRGKLPSRQVPAFGYVFGNKPKG